MCILSANAQHIICARQVSWIVTVSSTWDNFWNINCIKFTHVWLHCMQSFLQRVLLHASKLCEAEAEKRLPSGSTCRKFPGPSCLLTVHCRQITAPPAHHLHHDLLQSTQRCWTGRTTKARCWSDCLLCLSIFCLYRNTWLLKGGWRVGEWSLLYFKFTHPLVDLLAPHTFIHGGYAEETDKAIRTAYGSSTYVIFFTILSNLLFEFQYSSLLSTNYGPRWKWS